ncbi:AAA family ATPase [Microvirga sp. BT689]|uniref:AAA family ATPase n=1 Tax=Microvirga arvi TaxID=2778731 RepID=UPI0019500DDE|nr:AAA family ATPase [Microvirga arvi]MBM6579375.1 AAA family ATPase [Microvirga arvi]
MSASEASKTQPADDLPDLFGIELERHDIPPLDNGPAKRTTRKGRKPKPAAAVPAHKTFASSIDLIADLALHQALGREGVRLLRSDSAPVVIIQVPDTAWIDPISGAANRLTRSRAHVVNAKSIARRDEEMEHTLAQAIRYGRPLVAISPDPGRLLPSSLRGAADLTVVIPPLTSRFAGRVIRRWCKGPGPSDLKNGDVAGLTIVDFAAALRPASTYEQSLERIRRAVATRRTPLVPATGPYLHELTGYGAAHAWAMAMADDVERVRNGQAKPEVLEWALVSGPPGTGKSQLAMATARTANVPLLQISISQLFTSGSGHLGTVLQRLNLFRDELMHAAAYGPVLALFEEADALPSRSSGDGAHADFWAPVITAWLLLIDEVRASGLPILLMATTNHAQALDPALTRPGRFDRHFTIMPPSDPKDLIGILRVHLGTDLAGDDLGTVARLGLGATGAEVAGWVRGARRRARQARRALRLDDLMAEVAPPDRRPWPEQQATARHEAAHAIVATRLGIHVTAASILAEGQQAGWTQLRMPSRTPTRAQLEAHAVALLAGRAADMMFGDGPDTGAATDLRQATDLVATLHGTFGLGRTLASRIPSKGGDQGWIADPVLSATVEDHLQALMQVAHTMVAADRAAITALADELLRDRVVDAVAILVTAERHRPRYRVPAGRRPPG